MYDERRRTGVTGGPRTLLNGCHRSFDHNRMNPGGSVKDRAALYLVTDAEKRGVLKPGGTVVEGKETSSSDGL